MTVRIPDNVRNAMCDACVDLFDAGASAGTIEIRDGTQPADADDPAAGSVLATVTLNDPAFGNAGASNPGEAILDTTGGLTTTGSADGDATWFRMYDSNGVGVLDGSVTATGGGGDLELNTVTISTGVDVEITSGTVTMPGG